MVKDLDIYKNLKKTTKQYHHFPFYKPDLLKTWTKFVNRADWFPTSNSVICIKHFEENLIIDNEKRKKLNWSLNQYQLSTLKQH